MNQNSFKPYPHQLEFLISMNNGCRRALLRWHRRAGKDAASFAFMAQEAINNPGVYWYFLDTYAQAKKVIWEAQDHGSKLIHLIPEELVLKHNNSDLSIELKNGSLIRLIGADTLDRLVGVEVKGMVLSEYAVFDGYPKLWMRMEPILLRNNGWAIFNSTPRGRNHMYRLEEAVKGNPNWFVSEAQTLWPDKPYYTAIYSPEQIAEAKLTTESAGEESIGMDPQDYLEQEYGVSYGASVQGSYLQEYVEAARASGRIGQWPANYQLHVDTYWDLGGKDDVVCWFIQHIDGKRRVIDYHESSQKSVEFYVDLLKSKPYKYRTHYLPWDAASGNRMGGSATSQLFMQGLTTAGLMADVRVVPRMPVQDGINALRSIFHTFWFNEETTDKGIRHLELHKRKFNKTTGSFMDGKGAHDRHSHAVDAFRLIACADNLISDWGIDNDPQTVVYYPSYDLFLGPDTPNSQS